MTSNLSALTKAHKENGESHSPANQSTEQCPLQSCELTTLLIKCSHSNRSFELDVAKGNPTRNEKEYVLQVISKPGNIEKIAIDFSASQCCQGSNECPTVSVSGGEVNTKSKNPLKLDVLPAPLKHDDIGFITFLTNYLLPNDLAPEIYAIQSHKCSGTGQLKAQVEVFPSFSWGGKVSFGYVPPANFDRNKNKHKGLDKLQDQGSWSLAGKCDLKIGGQTWSFGASAQEKQSEYFPTLKNTVHRIVTFLSELWGEFGESKIPNINWPDVSIGGSLALAESGNTYDVDIEGNVFLDMNPLIGGTISIDILEWLIRIAAPGYGEFLLKVKDKAAQGVGNNYIEGHAIIAILLKINGGVKGKLKWTKKAQDKWLSSQGDKSGEVTANLDLSLTAKVEMDGSVFWVKITVGAELALKAATKGYDGIGIIGKLFATTENDKPSIGGKLIFTGAAIYYTYYAEFGVRSMESDKQKGKKRKRLRAGSTKSQAIAANKLDASKKGQKMEELVKLFNSAEWPNLSNDNQESKSLDSVSL